MQQDVSGCMRHLLSPLRGWDLSRARTHGLRRGLQSSAALRLRSPRLQLTCLASAWLVSHVKILRVRGLKSGDRCHKWPQRCFNSGIQNDGRRSPAEKPASSRKPAPKERKNAALGASRGYACRRRTSSGGAKEAALRIPWEESTS